MQIVVGVRVHQLAATACVLFIALHLCDGLWKPSLLRGPYINFWLYDFFAWIVVPASALAALHRWTALSTEDYGLVAQLGWKDLVQVLPLPLFALFIVYVIAYFFAQGLFSASKPEFSYITALKSLGSLWILGTIYLSVTAGLVESIFYIGLPWFCLSRVLNNSASARRGFAVLTAVLFAAAHHENGAPNVVAAFFFQLVAASWFFKLGTLWPIIGAHTLIDVYYFWPWPWARFER